LTPAPALAKLPEVHKNGDSDRLNIRIAVLAAEWILQVPNSLSHPENNATPLFGDSPFPDAPLLPILQKALSDAEIEDRKRRYHEAVRQAKLLYGPQGEVEP
jgi:hypothetical protein